MSETNRTNAAAPEDNERQEKTLRSPTELWSDPSGDASVYRFIRKIRNVWHVVVARDCGDDLEIVDDVTVATAREMHEHRIGTRLILE